MEEQRGGPDVLEMIHGQVGGFADDALVAGLRRSDEIRSQFELRVISEGGRQPFGRQLDAISLHAGETNLKTVAIWSDGPYHHRLPRRRWRHDDGFCREVERHAEDVGVLRVEESFVVQLVDLPAKRTSDHLLTQELRPESANA
jgi:hypothetical protein